MYHRWNTGDVSHALDAKNRSHETPTTNIVLQAAHRNSIEKRNYLKDYAACCKYAGKGEKHSQEQIPEWIEDPTYFNPVEDCGAETLWDLRNGDRLLWLGPKVSDGGGISHELEAFHGYFHGWAKPDKWGNDRIWVN